MNGLAIALLMLLSLASSISSVNAEGMKIASVDVRKVFSGWEYAAEVEAKLEKKRQALEEDNKDRLAVIEQYELERNEVYQAFQAKRDSVSVEEKAKFHSELMELRRNAFALEENRRNFYVKAKQNLDREGAIQSRLMLDQITEVIQAYAQAESYDMVIEMGGHTTQHLPFFLHLDHAEDITQVIIKRLNGTE